MSACERECMKWAKGLKVVNEFHDQGLCVKAITAGGGWIQMFEVKRPRLPQLCQRTIIPIDTVD